MRIERIMTKSVASCRPDDTLAKAAQLMMERDCGCLSVIGDDIDNRVTGIITDRDICMRAMVTQKPLQELSVSEAMAKAVRVCSPSDNLADAEETMRAEQIRRLPVVDENASLVGIVSLADLAREAARELSKHAPEITETEVGDTLAAICKPSDRPLAA
jgi:CBS domain-containing protein